MVAQWGWFLAKNALGWLLIVSSFVLGPLVPGPGGIPLFLIGFALITFPGKRRLTARVLRGITLRRGSRGFRIAAAAVALVLPAAVLVYLAAARHVFAGATPPTKALAGAAYLAAVLLTWWAASHADGILNWVLRLVPRARRTMRPWLRRHGVDLLPPRHRRRHAAAASADGAASAIHETVHTTIRTTPATSNTDDMHDQILTLQDHHRTRLVAAWDAAKVWLRRAVGLGITVAIFAWILKPIVRHWDEVGQRVMATNWWRVLLASAMFAAFLYFFRVLAWWRILKRLGHRLPLPAATRIWSTSELARYLPGVIWQVVGRAYLCKPYGVSGRVCSTSQILELTIFLLANLIMALGCLLFMGYRHFHGAARGWLFAATAIVPVLLVLIHPRVFYAVVNGVLAKLGKPPLERKLKLRGLLGLLVWSLVGLAWQGLAIWLIVHYLLDLKLAKWWVVTGAYCLAWCAGFLAVWAPGGIGVREAVFIAAMEFALPRAVLHGQLADLQKKYLFLIFLSVLLRIWATVGELMLAGVAYLSDLRGAVGIHEPRPPRAYEPLHGGAKR